MSYADGYETALRKMLRLLKGKQNAIARSVIREKICKLGKRKAKSK